LSSEESFATLDSASDHPDKAKSAYELVTQLVAEHPDDVDVLWRAARAGYTYAAQQQEGTDIKKELVLKAAENAQKAVTAAPDRFETNKWAAITIGRRGDYTSTKDKIESSYLIREMGLKAAGLKPDDWVIQQLLGVWHFQIANIDFVSRQLAKAFFATPPSATYQEGIPYFERAEELHPNARSRFSLGETYEKIGDKAKAKEWYAKCVEIHAELQEVKDLQATASARLAKL